MTDIDVARLTALRLSGFTCPFCDAGKDQYPCMCPLDCGAPGCGPAMAMERRAARHAAGPGQPAKLAFIIFRDRLDYAARCVAAMEAAGLKTVIIDQGSTWPPAVSALAVREALGRPVLRRDGGHPRDIWGWAPFLGMCGGDRYIVTDCDVVPSEDCPADWPEYLSHVLDTHPDCRKAGLGLRTDRIPEHYRWRDRVIGWEAQYWLAELEDGVFEANVDTTLAMYRPLHEMGFGLDASLRTGPPYVADHLAWYENLDGLTPELAWYHEHAEPGISFWAPANPEPHYQWQAEHGSS